MAVLIDLLLYWRLSWWIADTGEGVLRRSGATQVYRGFQPCGVATAERTLLMRYLYILLGLAFLPPGILKAGPPQNTPGPVIPVEAWGEGPPAPIHDGSPCPFQCEPVQQEDTTQTGNENFSNFIGFLSNPLQNIDPRAVTEIYPIFGSAWTSEAGPVPSADFQVYAPGLTVALSDRLAIGLNQGGYADVHLSRRQFDRLARFDPQGRFGAVRAGGDRSGWLNLGGFFQYTLIRDVPNQFLLTAGLHWEAPCGSREIFQGRGPAHRAPYLTIGKEFGCNHILATTGYLFPAGGGDDNTRFFYANLHLHRQLFGWFYPLVELNWTYHERGVAIDLPARRGFFELDNFEASGNILTGAFGANAVLVRDRLEFGAAYTTSLATQRDFDFNGLLVRMTFRF